jgi:hypothetical protein
MVCYLCGLTIEGAISRDHVPPQQLWSPEIRRKFNVDQLITLPTHWTCNDSYKLDEEYAIRALSTAGYETPTGKSVVQHGWAKARRGKAVGLHRAILNSFDARPGGLHLPNDRVVLRIDGDRIKRVIWKIIRGLWFLEYQSSLPKETRYLIVIQEPENKDTPQFEEFWNIVRAQPSRGKYQAVFAHKYFRFEEYGEVLHGWAMLLWDSVIVYCIHFDPDKPPDMTAEGPRGRHSS